MSTYTKDPDAVLDYQFDWSRWLAEGDTITAADVTVTAGDVVIDSESFTATAVTVWVSGGTVDSNATLTARVTTAQGRTDDRSITLEIRQR